MAHTENSALVQICIEALVQDIYKTKSHTEQTPHGEIYSLLHASVIVMKALSRQKRQKMHNGCIVSRSKYEGKGIVLKVFRILWITYFFDRELSCALTLSVSGSVSE